MQPALHHLSNKKGFTLVELLVVITIIAILSVIGITVFTNVQKSARDSRRRADIDAISKALEVHFNDAVANQYDAVRSIFFSGSKVPKDPKNNTKYIYKGVDATNDNNEGGRSNPTYTVCADLESNGWTGAQEDYCRSNQQ